MRGSPVGPTGVIGGALMVGVVAYPDEAGKPTSGMSNTGGTEGTVMAHGWNFAGMLAAFAAAARARHR